MDEATYKVWWPLHIRAAKGETLNPEEQSIYEAGCRTLDAEERLDGRLEELKQARQRTEVLEAERAASDTLRGFESGNRGIGN